MLPLLTLAERSTQKRIHNNSQYETRVPFIGYESVLETPRRVVICTSVHELGLTPIHRAGHVGLQRNLTLRGAYEVPSQACICPPRYV